jgi:hypothetical protein
VVTRSDAVPYCSRLVLRTRLALPLAAVLICAVPAVAQAADPIMPLAQVQAGMRCTGYSVIRGTEISAFDVEVIDVLAGPDPQILVRVSGPAVDESGIAEGFSGSPVRCTAPDGTLRTAGAIAQGTGDYGNKVVLATPIETLLGEPVDVPAGAKAMPRSLARKVRAVATPLSFSGVSGPVATALKAAGQKTGRALYAAPAAPRAVTFGQQQLQPGSSVAVGLSGGDIAAGAVGTVTYVDGDAVWAFGHPLDGAGRRSLLLQDAYVYTVISNPVDSEQLTSYKLAAPGHDLGTLTNDAPAGVVGRLGALPDRFPMRVTARDLDSGRVAHENLEIADETAVGQPTGTSSLMQVGPVAIAQAAYDILRGSPARQSGEMCVRVTLRERKAPLRFCNTYVGGSPNAAGAPLVADFAGAISLLDTYNFGVLHVTGVDVNIKLRRELRQAYLLGADGPRRVRRGRDIVLRIRAQHVRGARFTKTVKVHVPKFLAEGEHVLTITGTPADAAGGDAEAQDLASTFTVTLGGDDSADDPGPRTLRGLASAFAATSREDGVTASFRDPGDSDGETATREIEVFRDPDLRISGSARLRLAVRP